MKLEEAKKILNDHGYKLIDEGLFSSIKDAAARVVGDDTRLSQLVEKTQDPFKKFLLKAVVRDMQFIATSTNRSDGVKYFEKMSNDKKSVEYIEDVVDGLNADLNNLTIDGYKRAKKLAEPSEADKLINQPIETWNDKWDIDEKAKAIYTQKGKPLYKAVYEAISDAFKTTLSEPWGLRFVTDDNEKNGFKKICLGYIKLWLKENG